MNSRAHWMISYGRGLVAFAFMLAIIYGVFVDRVRFASPLEFLAAWVGVAGVIALTIWWLVRRPKIR